jgi:2-oxoacid:acceptor oxidoreductase gamma subunit (pyruvate/2-ketoisovalerate family)
MKEIRLHGRGGQGAVTIGGALVYCFAISGKCASAIPQFGFERRGAPVESYVRMDDNPIREKTRIYTPDCLMVLDSTLLNAVDIFNGLRGDGILVINERCSPEELKLPQTVKKVGIVDATKIAVDIFKANITNTCMLGAFVATTRWVELETVLEGLGEYFKKDLLTKNQRAAREGFEKCRVFDLRG